MTVVSLGRSEALAPPRPVVAGHARADIQLLRAWAVLVVVLNHAGLSALPGGFFGVDIFFVVSGYLMTGIIDEALETGRFSFVGFYARRARRLLPAAYATLAVSALAAPILLEATEFESFVAQLGGAFTFTANVVLWKQVDYFGTQAAMKPLLHMWSLAIEEQFYFLLPIVLVLCPRRFRLALLIAAVAGGAALCVAMKDWSVSAAFYLLPGRGWELAIGSAMALLVRRGFVRPAPLGGARLACAAILLAVPFVAGDEGHPGSVAALVCSATALLLVPGAASERFKPALRPFTLIGDRSYSLYLVHWPVFAFANNVFLGPVPGSVTLGLVALIAALTEAQYRLVEQRFRTLAFTPRSVAVLVLLPALILAASWPMARASRTADTEARGGGFGLAPACDFRDRFTAPPECASAPAPTTLLWGDSFAMALAPGLAASLPDGVVQATKTVCGPILGLSPTNGALYDRSWAEGCTRFNASVLDYLATHPRIERVVLSSVLAQYVPGAEPHWRALVGTDGSAARLEPQDEAALLRALDDTVAAIRRLGKQVLLVAPPPAGSFDIARCLERTGQNRPTITDHRDCAIPLADYRAHRGRVIDFLDAVEARGSIPVLDLDAPLCGPESCVTRLDGVMLYRDKDHLGREGSRALAERMGWGTLVPGLAR